MDIPVKSLGSQGQQKSYLVALKLAKFDYIKRKAGFSPILLLDDIFDKFDAERVEQIIRLVGNHRFRSDLYYRYSSETGFMIFFLHIILIISFSGFQDNQVEEIIQNGNKQK